MIQLRSADAGGLQLDLTALIDIIFIVLVFLLLTANSPLLALKVEVPDQAPPETLAPLTGSTSLAINVLPTPPHWAVNRQPLADLAAVEALLRQQLAHAPNTEVVIAADRKAPVAPLMALLALLQQLEISNTRVLMEP